jgi:hypothetical protein
MAEEIVFDVRKHKRFNLTDVLPVYIETSSVRLRSDKKIEGVVENISSGGAMIITSIFIPRNATIQIEFPPLDSLPASLRTNSRVVHHKEPRLLLTPLPLKASSRVAYIQAKITSSHREEDKDKHFYYMGIEFLDVPPETRSLINEWVKKMRNAASQEMSEVESRE